MSSSSSQDSPSQPGSPARPAEHQTDDEVGVSVEPIESVSMTQMMAIAMFPSPEQLPKLTPLHRAAATGDYAAVEAIIKAYSLEPSLEVPRAFLDVIPIRVAAALPSPCETQEEYDMLLLTRALQLCVVEIMAKFVRGDIESDEDLRSALEETKEEIEKDVTGAAEAAGAVDKSVAKGDE